MSQVKLVQELERIEEISELVTLMLFVESLRQSLAQAECDMDNDIVHDMSGDLDYIEDELKEMIKRKQ